MTTNTGARRPLFIATILTGSFLLFLVQPMVARMALPRLGGAPNVWNSAMLVYQALLLAGYGYAHWLSRMAVRRQAMIHLALLVLAGLTLPIALADLPPPQAGQEALWVPLLLLATIGPVFFLVSAQAPLMQAWFSADPRAGEPWALYAASNLGSFGGLIAYPLLAEPLLSIKAQSLGWSLGYAALILLIALAARARWQAASVGAVTAANDAAGEAPGWPRIALWLVLAAVPSGLMLSTTTHLTTDVFAMPLLWVIPLGLYLLSFTVAFSDRASLSRAIIAATPVLLLLAGGLAMAAKSSGTMLEAIASVALLFVVAVALHRRMYDTRPHASRLTLFYFVMSAGGALGGLFTALIAPMVFDWVWEHPLLVLAAAALVPMTDHFDWRRLPGLDPGMARVGAAVLISVAALLAWNLLAVTSVEEPVQQGKGLLVLGVALMGVLLTPWRGLYLAVLAMLMLAQGGVQTAYATYDGARTRSYFGIYTVRDYPHLKLRTLAHGTTLHGQQSLAADKRHEPLTYYGPSSGIGLALTAAPALLGDKARIGVVGLGTGTLACYHQPGQAWHYFEIDPAVLDLSRDGTFTYLKDCAPKARVIIGDARIELTRMPQGGFDVLAIDAFSSDAIPLHLMTDEAFGTYLDKLSPRGLLLIHISNRFIELEPVLAALAKKRRLASAVRHDNTQDRIYRTPSTWVAMSRDPAMLARLTAFRQDAGWEGLLKPAERVWTDDHASILPYVRWQAMLGSNDSE